MRVRFIACDACGRHVREGDTSCPFCGTAAPVTPAVERVLKRGLSRAAMFAAGTAGVVVAMTDCGSGNVSTTYFYGVASFADGGVGPDAADGADEDGNVGTGVFYGIATDAGAPPDEASTEAGDASSGEASADAGTPSD